MRHSRFHLIFAAIIMGLIQQAAHAGEIWLTIDQVHTRKFKSHISQIVVGNPSIADVQVGANQQIFFYGKGPGLTNIAFFDLAGNQIDNIKVRVQNPSAGFLVMHNGLDQVSYSCASKCQAIGSIGDNSEVFTAIQGQVSGKASNALEAAAAAVNSAP